MESIYADWIYPDKKRNRAIWPNTTFAVCFDLRENLTIDVITVLAYLGNIEAGGALASLRREVGPFDDIRPIIQEMVIESAIKASSQLRIWE